MVCIVDTDHGESSGSGSVRLSLRPSSFAMHPLTPHPRIQYWQWPNVLALDAVIIAIAWQTVLSLTHDEPIGISEQLVLGLSVWLTYTADRLFDVRNIDESTRLSDRHWFAQRNQKRLWMIWWVALALDLSIALLHLNATQLIDGVILLSLCLSYTALNQLFSKYFFPKELCVALIFAGGSQVFVQDAQSWLIFTHLGALYLLNCLLIANNEQSLDRALKIRSLAVIGLAPTWMATALYLVSASLVIGQQSLPILSTALSAACLGFIRLYQKHQTRECFRVLTDAALLIGPNCYFLYYLSVK